MQPEQPTDAPSQGEAGDSRGGDYAARGGKAKALGLPVELAPGEARPAAAVRAAGSTMFSFSKDISISIQPSQVLFPATL